VHHQLKHDRDHLDINLRAIHADGQDVRGEAVEYRARVLPTYAEWIKVPGRSLCIPDIAPGAYTVAVQARYPGTEWGKEVRMLLYIDAEEAPWYLVYTILGVSVVLMLWSARTVLHSRSATRAQELERVRMAERRRIARDLHDDVGTGLARIVVLSDAVASQHGADPTTATIAETAREVIENMRSIVWVMKTDDDSMTTLLAYMRDKIGEVLADHGIEFVYSESIVEDAALHSAARWNVMMCLKEIAMNIVRHSKATRVHMRVTSRYGYLNLHISDDGVGFDHVLVKSGGGLSHIRERMTEIGGTAGIGSYPEEGTKILLVVPLGPRHGSGEALSNNHDERQ
jgi:signal transduction histidine kinase